MEKSELKEMIEETIEKNIDSGYTEIKRILKEENQIDIKKEKDFIKQVFDEYVKIDLKYSKKNNETISKITPKFKELKERLKLKTSDTNIILLTKNNAEEIEKAIKEDENYKYSFFEHLFFQYAEKADKSEDIKNSIKQIPEDKLIYMLKAIDLDNSTNVWRYKSRRDGLKKMAKYIMNSENNFFGRLNEGEDESKKSLQEELEKCGIGLRSISSKICKYFEEYIYHIDDIKNKKLYDNKFYISDRYVRHVLPFYLKEYNIPFPKKKRKKEEVEFENSNDFDSLAYCDLHKKLDELREEANKGKKDNEQISRHELDHILWYCYKSFKL